jgi:hypothetical protein
MGSAQLYVLLLYPSQAPYFIELGRDAGRAEQRLVTQRESAVEAAE